MPRGAFNRAPHTATREETAMTCYEPPPLVPHWLTRLAQATLGAACLLGLLASIWIALYICSAIAGSL